MTSKLTSKVTSKVTSSKRCFALLLAGLKGKTGVHGFATEKEGGGIAKQRRQERERQSKGRKMRL